MARIKRTRSAVLENAETRAAAIATLPQPLELGGELTLTAYQTEITGTRTKLANYNSVLADADQARRDFVIAERKLADWSDRMLAGVGAYYGKNSDVYAQAGGVKKSERKRPVRSTAASTTGIANAA
ncbi:hypothetical protein [Rariglobus hedericola]|uniref:TolC family protein n=1 Tax=Rariglobus hedericola TaxID=2597822 RepID=A0A556QQN5_9BACT|nr:hypothetical protein [Rariglobus hedericola]TSJ78950.1 hypothetical protein FPL22_06510 [Rariglobus hedericola]